MLNHNGITIHKGKIHLTIGKLMEFEVSKNYIKKALSKAKGYPNSYPERLPSWHHIKGLYGDRKTVWVCYDTIPEQTRVKLPNREELLKMSIVQTLFKQGLKPIAALDKQTLYKCGLPSKAIALVSEQAQWCSMLNSLVHFDKKQYYPTVTDYNQALPTLLPKYLKLPKNPKKLQEKLQTYKKQGIAALMPKYYGNTNSVKYADKKVIAIITQMRVLHNYPNAHIIRHLPQICKMLEIKCPSEGWLKNYLARPDTKFITSTTRHGNRRFAQDYLPYIRVAQSEHSGDCWQIDGTRLNLIEHLNGKDYKFLYIIAIMDLHSHCIIAYTLGSSRSTIESRHTYTDVLRLAIAHTGYLPAKLVLDRFPGHNTTEWKGLIQQIQQIGTTVEYKHTATGKAQIERKFHTLQSVFMQNSPYYYGEGVKSTREYAHRSETDLAKMRKKARAEGWNKEQAMQEAHRIIYNYNNTPLETYSKANLTDKHLAPQQKHEKSSKKHTIHLTAVEYNLLFGLKRTVTLRKGQVKIEIEKTPYYYNVDYKTMKNYTGKKVIVRYDIMNLKQVHLYEVGTEKWLGSASEAPQVKIYGTNLDYTTLTQERQRIKKIEQQRKEELAAKTKHINPNEVEILLGGLGDKTTKEQEETNYLFAQAVNSDIAPKETQPTQRQEDDIDVSKELEYQIFNNN